VWSFCLRPHNPGVLPVLADTRTLHVIQGACPLGHTSSSYHDAAPFPSLTQQTSAGAALGGACAHRTSSTQQAAARCQAHPARACAQVSAADERIDATLDLDGERQGVHRVAAALQAHAWPGLARKPAPASAAGPAPPPAAAVPATAAASCNGTPASAAEGGADGSQAAQAGASEAGRDAGAPAPSGEREREGGAGAGAAGEGSEQRPSGSGAGGRGGESRLLSDGSGAGRAAPPQENGHGRAAEGSGGRAAEAASGGGGAWGLGGGEGDGLGEGLEDDFERLLGGMASERARIRGLPDADRRAAAARMAERLLAAVGLDEDDASDSDAM